MLVHQCLLFYIPDLSIVLCNLNIMFYTFFSVPPIPNQNTSRFWYLHVTATFCFTPLILCGLVSISRWSLCGAKPCPVGHSLCYSVRRCASCLSTGECGHMSVLCPPGFSSTIHDHSSQTLTIVKLNNVQVTYQFMLVAMACTLKRK